MTGVGFMLFDALGYRVTFPAEKNNKKEKKKKTSSSTHLQREGKKTR